MVERNVNDSSQEAKNCLAAGFRTMMEAPASLVAKQLLSLRRRLQSGGNLNMLLLPSGSDRKPFWVKENATFCIVLAH